LIKKNLRPINIDYLSLLKKPYRAVHRVDVRIEPHLFVKGHDPSGFSEDVEKNGFQLYS
jgi:hypothetical protein